MKPGDTVYFMSQNRVKSGEIYEIQTTKLERTDETRETITYNISATSFTKDKIFKTKKALLDSL